MFQEIWNAHDLRVPSCTVYIDGCFVPDVDAKRFALTDKVYGVFLRTSRKNRVYRRLSRALPSEKLPDDIPIENICYLNPELSKRCATID